MDIEYEITIEDEVEFTLYCLTNSPAYQKAWKNQKLGLITLASSFILIAIVWIFLLKDIEGGLFLIIGLFLIYILWHNYNPRMKRRRLTKFTEDLYGETPNALLCKKTITIEADGLYEKSDFIESKRFWRSIREIIQTERHLYFFETKLTGIIIPKIGFPDEASFNLFTQTAKELRATALNENPEP